MFWKQANFDALTNLPNRRLMRDRWKQAVHNHRRSGNSLALMLIDLDHFKKINDSKGHSIGDELLVQAAESMLNCLGAKFKLSGHEVLISGSLGVSLYPANGDSLEDLLRQADQAMYDVKGKGGNGYCFSAQPLEPSRESESPNGT